MRVAAFLPTHHLPEESLPWMDEARGVFDEFLIFIDERRVTSGTRARAQSLGVPVRGFHSDTWLGSDFAAMARACASDWVFLIEYDEQLSAEWKQPEWRRLLEDTPYTHFWSPRRWLVDGNRYITVDPWWPDFQTRLFRNNLPGTAFARNVHETIYVPGAGACFQNLAIHHHVLSFLSRSEREEKTRRYEALRPGGGLKHYYLFEDYSPPSMPLPAPVTFDREREITCMEKLSPAAMAAISLKVSGVPREVGVSALFWICAHVENATNKPLHPAPPYPVRLAYHWIEKSTRQMVVFEGIRSGLFPGLPPSRTTHCPMAIVAPARPGEYLLQATIIQEGVCWFENVRPDGIQESAVRVRAKSGNQPV